MSEKTVLYTKECKRCRKVFRTDNKAVYVCTECKEKNKEKHSRKRIKTVFKVYGSRSRDISIRNFVHRLNLYNDKHGTSYTYGQAVMLMDKGEINL